MCWSPAVEVAFGKLAKLKRLTLEQTEREYLEDEICDNHPLIAKLRASCPQLGWVWVSWLGTWRLRPNRCNLQ
ncbi:hypothetical protein M407DRAFT_241085 [Tulasnella calospora MUT 4182]|uniref:Uncharacterized protein n=1 Tax=Tulasnella calospora MUT 4182 TaxID=1051891 RepID=A0A0C3QUV4_9AGAM|nr:hypothetical protein M407DRAFT_241085 [Tulasnella calospora MUT 4182]